MILPTKHLHLENSIIAKGSDVILNIDTTETVTSLWSKVSVESKIQSFQEFIIVLDFLYACKLISYQNKLIKVENAD